ncbi:phosphoribosyltransferase [Candidatus Gottesmanbacteria bacterium]|nr:phosphoribosyltransferase [Candidatus Gottesmanbacteria bacterium]
MFQNREEAGKLLAAELSKYKNNQDAVVLAIPRGGVVVGRQIADKLSLPLILAVVKKIGAPGNPELAIGALAPSNTKFIDWDLVFRSNVGQDYLDAELDAKRNEIEERVQKFKIRNLKSVIRNKKIIILTDDGIATGATTRAAINYIKIITKNQETIAKIILAIPVIAKETYDKIKKEVNKIFALEIPQSFNAVGQFYKEFPQVSDEEVMELL